jgi:hypothetical protein
MRDIALVAKVNFDGGNITGLHDRVESGGFKQFLEAVLDLIDRIAGMESH